MKRNPVKYWYMHVQFEAIGVNVTAKTRKEAREKIYAKLKKKDIIKLLDKRNCYLDYNDKF